MQNTDTKDTKKLTMIIAVTIAIIVAACFFLGKLLIEQLSLSSFKKDAVGTWYLYKSERKDGSSWVYRKNDSDQLQLTLKEDGSGKIDNYFVKGKSVNVNLISKYMTQFVEAKESLFEAKIEGQELKLFPKNVEVNYDTYIFVREGVFDSTVEKYMEEVALPKVTPKPEWEAYRPEKAFWQQIDVDKRIEQYVQNYVRQGIPLQKTKDNDVKIYKPLYEVNFTLNNKDNKEPAKLQIAYVFFGNESERHNPGVDLIFPEMERYAYDIRNSRGDVFKTKDYRGNGITQISVPVFSLFSRVKWTDGDSKTFKQLDSLFRDDGEIRIIFYKPDSVDSYTLTEEQKNIFRAVLDICWEMSSYCYNKDDIPAPPPTPNAN